MVRLIVVFLFCSFTYAFADDVSRETSADEHLDVDQYLKLYEKKLQRTNQKRRERSQESPREGTIEGYKDKLVDAHLKRCEQTLKRCERTLQHLKNVREGLPQLRLLNGSTEEQLTLMSLMLDLRESSTKLLMEQLKFNQHCLKRGPSPSRNDVLDEANWKRRIDNLESVTNQLKRRYTLANCAAEKMMQL